MAKTKGPLMSLDAHGSFGRVLTYSHRKSGRQVRTYNKPLVAATAKQRAQRRLTEFLVAQWQNMSAGDKATWEANARLSGPNITGYHYFLREAQRDLYTHTGLCGYWHCNEIVGGKVLDLSGNKNHGTLQPAYPANAPVLVDSYKTKFSKGLLYDGIDEYVNCGNDISLSITGDLSFEIWIKISNYPVSWTGILTKALDDLNSEFIFRMKNLDLGQFFFGNGTSTSVLSWNPKVDLPLNAWTQIIGVRKSKTYLKLFFNSIEKRGIGITDDATPTSQPVIIGFRSGYFKGIIDEVCLYNRALSTAEIATRYRFATREVD